MAREAGVTRKPLNFQTSPEAEASRTPGAAVPEFLASSPKHQVQKQAGTATAFH